MTDKINPEHYKQGSSETIDVIESAVTDPASFLHGNALKYLCRANHKGDRVNDLGKARWYLDRLIESLGISTVIIDGVECHVSDVRIEF